MSPGIDAEFFSIFLQLLCQAVLFSTYQLSTNMQTVAWFQDLSINTSWERKDERWEERVDLRHQLFLWMKKLRQPSGALWGPNKVLLVPNLAGGVSGVGGGEGTLQSELMPLLTGQDHFYYLSRILPVRLDMYTIFSYKLLWQSSDCLYCPVTQTCVWNYCFIPWG